MLKLYKFVKFCFFYSYITTMIWLLANSATWLLSMHAVAFIFYVTILQIAKGKRQVTLILLLYYLTCPINIITSYVMYNSWLLVFASLIVFIAVTLYLHLLRNEIEYL